jgi:rhodanese-related sulfurtransferase
MSDEINLEDHIVQDNKERVEIQSNGDTLWFDIRELSGYEISEIEDNSLSISQNGDVDLDTDEFRLQMLRTKIQDTNVPNLPVFLKRCPDEIYSELLEHVNDPISNEENEGN